VYGHSLFTGCLIEGLTHGLGRGGNRVTTGSELGLYLQRRVAAYPHSRQTPDFGTFDFDDRGEMVIQLRVDPWEDPTLKDSRPQDWTSSETGPEPTDDNAPKVLPDGAAISSTDAADTLIDRPVVTVPTPASLPIANSPPSPAPSTQKYTGARSRYRIAILVIIAGIALVLALRSYNIFT
jgi:hypothetical protein